MYYPLTNFTVCWRFEINHQICWICRFINCANRNCLYSMNDFILKWNGFYLDQENYARWGRDRDNKRLSLRGITVDIFENPLIIVKTCFSDQIWNQEHYLPRVNPVWLTVNGIWGGSTPLLQDIFVKNIGILYAYDFLTLSLKFY